MFFLMPWKSRSVAGETLPETSLRLNRFLEAHRLVPIHSEPEFMGLGGFLQSIHGAAEEMTGLIQETIALLGVDRDQPEAEGRVLSDLRQLSANALEELAASRREIAGNLGLIRTIGKHLEGLSGHGETLRKIGLHLGVVGLNIGVESVRSPAGRELFGEIAPEVRQVAGKIHTLAEEIDHDSRHRRREQEKISHAIAIDLQTLEQLAGRAEQTIKVTLDQAETATGTTLAALKRAETHGSAIAAQLSGLIMEMQLHDSISQRIAHVVTNLEELMSELNQMVGSEPAAGRLAAMRRVVDLQADQLDRIIDEVRTAAVNSRQAFTEIARHLAQLQQACQRQPDPDGRTPDNAAAPAFPAGGTTNKPEPAGAKDPIKPLLAALRHLHELLTQSNRMTQRLNSGARTTAEMSTRLSERMRQIETIRLEIHLKALNTIVMSARLGDEGLGMEVLAQETKRLSDSAHQFVDAAALLHREISTAAQNLHLQRPEQAAATSDGRNLRELTVSLEQFSLRSANAACAGIAEVHHGLQEADRQLAFLDRLADAIGADREQLVEISGLLARLSRGAEATFNAEETGRLEQLYTMEKERELHQAHLESDSRPTKPGSNANPATPAPKKGAAGTERNQAGGAGLDDNIELF